MIAAPKLRNLTPGWILQVPDGYWHWRASDGLVACQKIRGPQIKIHKWDQEPRGRNEVCPICRKAEQRHNRPGQVTTADYESPKEPEVLKIDTLVSTGSVPKSKGMSVAEVAQLLDRNPTVIYRWLEDPKSGLHFDAATGRFPESDLPRLEQLDKERERRTRARKAAPAEKPAPPAKPAAKAPPKSKEDATAVCRMLGKLLRPEHVFLASMLDKPLDEFVPWCVDQAVVLIRERMNENAKAMGRKAKA